MGKILDFLTRDWVEGRFARMHDRHGRLVDPVEELRERVEARAGPAGKSDTDEEFRFPVTLLMGRCELEYAAGSEPSVIRGLCRQFTEAFVPLMATMDFSPMEEDGPRKTAAGAGGRRDTWLSRPLWPYMPKVWMIAAVSGDAELARRVAEPYRLDEPHQLNSTDAREMILRHALAGDRKGERAFAQRLKPGYGADFPPEVIEFPLGVIRNDPKTVLAGVKAVTTRFKGKWDLKKTRARYDKWAEKLGTKGRWSAGTWDEVLDQTRKNFFSYNFVFSWWALAWLNVARWRGMDDVFRDPKAFSEWVPLSLA
jgi:hypothetical protein